MFEGDSILALHPSAAAPAHYYYTLLQPTVAQQSKCLNTPGINPPVQSPSSFLPCSLCGQGLTLKTNISLRRTATVLKLPSQMSGLRFPGSAGGECLRSEVAVSPPLWRRDGSVGSSRVGSSKGVGTPGGRHQQDRQEVRKCKYTATVMHCIIFCYWYIQHIYTLFESFPFVFYFTCLDCV